MGFQVFKGQPSLRNIFLGLAAVLALFVALFPAVNDAASSIFHFKRPPHNFSVRMLGKNPNSRPDGILSAMTLLKHSVDITLPPGE